MRLLKLRVVEHIEELRTQLQFEAFAQSHVLDQGQVGIGVVRAIELVPARIADVSEESAAERGIVGSAGANVAIGIDTGTGTGEGIADYVGVGKRPDSISAVIKRRNDAV